MWKKWYPADFDADIVLSVEDVNCADPVTKDLSGYNMDVYCKCLKLTLITDASRNNIKLLNISGTVLDSIALRLAIATYSGLIVVAAGNINGDSATDIPYPAASSDNNILVVASSTGEDAVSTFSKYH